jgi:hypothetical protein
MLLEVLFHTYEIKLQRTSYEMMKSSCQSLESLKSYSRFFFGGLLEHPVLVLHYSKENTSDYLGGQKLDFRWQAARSRRFLAC